AIDCKCSICRMAGYLHLIVPATRFRLLRGADDLTEYTFNTGVAKHTFCRTCGIKPFYVPRSNPDGFDINVNCLERDTIEEIDVTPFDDTRRDQSTAAIRHLSR
ncbi:MAG TPA: GFA family protein, partial [Rudaea sp.]|nr:GFA family protein [Rudaea sp.]